MWSVQSGKFRLYGSHAKLHAERSTLHIFQSRTVYDEPDTSFAVGAAISRPPETGIMALCLPAFLRAFFCGRLIAAPADAPRRFARKIQVFLGGAMVC